jgi:type II secretory pathway component GspD/PulD (secretin)
MLTGVASARDSEPQQGTTSVSETHGASLRALLLEVGGRLHKTFITDPKVPDNVDLGGLHHQDISYPQLLSLLKLYGLVVVSDGNVLLVLPDANVRQEPLPLVSPENLKELDDEPVTSVIPIKDISAVQLVLYCGL